MAVSLKKQLHTSNFYTYVQSLLLSYDYTTRILSTDSKVFFEHKKNARMIRKSSFSTFLCQIILNFNMYTSKYSRRLSNEKLKAIRQQNKDFRYTK